MSFRKQGELIEISPTSIQAAETVIPIIDPDVMEDFRKIAANLKRIAPKADDFLYFSCVMMHAAEASLINEDGTFKLNKRGESVEAHWEKVSTSNGESLKWSSNDPSIKAYKNSNGDIFPEVELIKAYKKWIGKPLCIDHKSSSVDHVRGFIVDTYYDRNLKRVIALCALDKHNYPDLARKVATGYSNSVSMGTAVEKAICYDCGTVARTERDFCKHMISKSCYGEINVGLNPIELSIVVNGADGNAKIKHIIAAAQTLNSYVDEKEQELKKLAEQIYSATISSNNNDGNQNQLTVQNSDIEVFKNDVTKAISDLAKINSEKGDTNLAYNQSSGTQAMETTELSTTDNSLAPPHARYAELLTSLTSSIQDKLANIQQDLNTLATKKEDIMAGQKDNLSKQSYYQGAGGVNEPTPGQAKYPVDPLQDDLRENGDKQMVGQKPFPDVGDVNGMYPGYDSFPTGELERKKMLARAEVEERLMRRNAVIKKVKDVLENKKESYYQGAGGVNEPTPHKVKYPIDPLQDNLREKSDKQMVGQKPFPDVGDINGLHPSPDSAEISDELKRKEMLRRANKYWARFVKKANDDGSLNLNKSEWNVFLGENLILSKTVDEITDGQAEKLHSAVASEAFAQDLIKKIKTLGLDKVNSLYKKAQVPPPAPMGDSAPVPAGDDVGKDLGKDGDPKASAIEIAEKMRDLGSDMVEAVNTLTGDKSEMGEASPMLPAAADDSSDDKVSTATLRNLKNQLSKPLITEMKKAIAGLDDHAKELDSLVTLFDKSENNPPARALVNSIAGDTIADAKASLADSFALLGGYIKFSNGTDLIEKHAHDAELDLINGDNMELGHGELGDQEIEGMLNETGEDLDGLAMALDESGTSGSSSHVEDLDLVDLLADDLANDDNEAIMTEDPEKAAELSKKFPDASVELKAHATLEDRTTLRTKLAEGIKWNPIFKEFHPKGNALPGNFDTKPSDKLDVVENLEETHQKMMDVATSGPNVRKEAKEIQDLIVRGELQVKDLDMLVANGVDPTAVKYWKEFYGEMGPEGKEFATEFVKEHSKAQAEEEANTFRVKLARAYEMAYEMADREIIPRNQSAISAQVNDIMKWNDPSFESMKKVIAQHNPGLKKSAGRMPQVGIYGSEDTSSNYSSSGDDLASQLNEMFATSKSRRMF